MPTPSAVKPVEDTVPKVNDEVAVGADLDFQRRWWRMERIVWILFALLVLLDLLGVFGRGPLAKAHLQTSDGSMQISYERVERFGTPSELRVHFGSQAVHDGLVQLWVSDNIVKPLGNRRVIPEPLKSVIGQGGILYTFPATNTPASVAFALEPASVGVQDVSMRIPGFEEVRAKILVMP